MKLTVIGTGYVGLVVGACFADTGNEVTCVDIKKNKIDLLKRGEVPIYEPGLKELLTSNIKEGRLFFTTDIESAIKKAQLVFLAVGAPTLENGSVDLKHVLAVSRDIGRYMNEYKIIAIKSTVPVGTSEKVAKEIRKDSKHRFVVVSNPEFLKEGAAIDDFLRPDRIVIGTDNEEAAETMKHLYRPFVRSGKPILIMDAKSAELTKYVTNALLATKISFINDVANLCDTIGADIEFVRRAIGSDRRIGRHFIYPGTGYGGSCFPKDVKAIIHTGEVHGHNLEIIRAVEKVNRKQKSILMEKIESYFGSDLGGKLFAMWGLSFKPKTDDMREAPAIEMINILSARGAKIRAHDPEALSQARLFFKDLINDSLSLLENRYDALQGADALIVMTEWNVFREPDFDFMKKVLKRPVIFDGRNIYDPKIVKELGFDYFAIGRPNT